MARPIEIWTSLPETKASFFFVIDVYSSKWLLEISLLFVREE